MGDVDVAVTPESLSKSVSILRRHGARRIVLFGSSVTRPGEARDLDVACSGIGPREFLRAVGDLMDEVDVPVDLVDLTDETPFTRLIEERGQVVYEG